MDVRIRSLGTVTSSAERRGTQRREVKRGQEEHDAWFGVSYWSWLRGTSVPVNNLSIRPSVRLSVCLYIYIHGLGSSVGVATDYGLNGPGSSPGGGREFPPVQTGPGAHPASCKMGSGSFPRLKCGQGVLLTTHPLAVPRLWKGRAIPLPTLWATPGL